MRWREGWCNFSQTDPGNLFRLIVTWFLSKTADPLGDTGDDPSSSTGERIGSASAASLESRLQWLGMSIAIAAVNRKHVTESPLSK